MRGQILDAEESVKALVTVHPPNLLRLPDADAKAREYARFVEYLKIDVSTLKKLKRAA